MISQLSQPNRKSIWALSALSFLSSMVLAQTTPALVDFDAYETLTAEVKEHRKSRMLSAEEFAKVSREKKVIILDTRSDAMYKAVHVKGAIHLNFSDFTQDNLARIIPSRDYKILIYCNNNFISSEKKPVVKASSGSGGNYQSYFLTKAFVPEKAQAAAPANAYAQTYTANSSKKNPDTQVSYPPANAKPITLALNIPTYINLYGYGYRNVYELSELVNTYDTIIEFEGTAVTAH